MAGDLPTARSVAALALDDDPTPPSSASSTQDRVCVQRSPRPGRPVRRSRYRKPLRGRRMITHCAPISHRRPHRHWFRSRRHHDHLIATTTLGLVQSLVRGVQQLGEWSTAGRCTGHTDADRDRQGPRFGIDRSADDGGVQARAIAFLMGVARPGIMWCDWPLWRRSGRVRPPT